MRVGRWLVREGGPLRERVLRGGVWLLLADAVVQSASLIKLAIVGRLLVPSDFGLMAIALVALNWLEYFTQTGFRDALVRRSGEIRPYLDTMWTVQVARGMGLALVLSLGAPLGAWFFHNPEATGVIRAVALVTLLRGLINPAVVYLRRELDFQRDVIWRTTGVLVGLMVAIAVALTHRSVWALVLSVVAAQAAETVASYWVQPYRPRFHLELAKARELLHFGKWIFWSNAVVYLALYMDSATVGKVLGTAALGLYQVSLQLAVLPASQLGTHIHGVMFPAFSRIESAADLRRAWLWTLTLVCALVVPLACFLTVFAEPLVRLALGERWMGMAPALGILAWAGAATALTRLTSALLQAAGHPELPVRAALGEVFMLALLLYPLVTRFGIVGAAAAVAFSRSVASTYQVLLAMRLLKPVAGGVLRALRLAGLGSMPFLAAGLIVAHAPRPWSLVLAVLAVGLYLTILVTGLRLHTSLAPVLRSSFEG